MIEDWALAFLAMLIFAHATFTTHDARARICSAALCLLSAIIAFVLK